MNPVSVLVLFGLPLGIFSLADRIGGFKASAANVSPGGGSGKSQPAVTSTGGNRNQAMQLCAA
jgi:hypothetical protein